MRILFTRFPYESLLGGAEVQTIALMNALKAKGHDVTFIGNDPILLSRTPDIPIKYELDIGPPPVTRWAALSFLWRRKGMTAQLKDMLERERQLPEAVFMLSMSEKLLLTRWIVAKGVKVFWVEHDRVGTWLTKNPWLGMLKKESLRATVICVSELTRKKYVEMGFDENGVLAIPNGIDLKRFDKATGADEPAQAPRPPGALHVGCVARLSPEKGVDVLIQAVADLPGVTLDIIGTGRQEGYIRTMIHELERLSPASIGRIRLQRDVANLGPFYRSLDAFVLPSADNDPFGLVAAEAMSLGVPTIVTDACGIAGYLAHGTDAIITKAGDPQALREDIRLLSNPDMRKQLGAQGKNTAREKFSLERMVAEYEALL